MADSDKSTETKVVRLPREKGRIGRGADRFAARWRKGMRWVIWRLFHRVPCGQWCSNATDSLVVNPSILTAMGADPN